MRRNILALAAAVAAIALVGGSTRAASVTDFLDFTLGDLGGSGFPLPGRLYVPPEAASGPRPLILFLHGAGESGTNNTAQVNGNIDNLLAEAKLRGAYLYAPQTAFGWNSPIVTDGVMSMVDRALAEQNVDARRLYVTGLSMGGGGTWNILGRYGERFAAGVPICAVAPDGDVTGASLADQAIWAFHARDDGTVSFAITRRQINAILQSQGEPTPAYLPLGNPANFQYDSPTLDLHLTEYATGGHGIWGRVYHTSLGRAMYDWMFAHATVPEPGTATLALAALVPILRWGKRRGRR